MEILVCTLKELKSLGCSGIKISFEDEGALHNEVISMRKLTAEVGLELSVKIGGCEAKRDIVDCMDLDCDTIVAPMIESEFALKKFLKSLDAYKCDKKKGFNLETIQAYENLDTLSNSFDKVDFVTVGRHDFMDSYNKDKDFIDSEEMYNIIKNIFTVVREKKTACYMGGAISIKSKNFINKLVSENLLDKFETRYVIFDVNKINLEDFDKLLCLAVSFEIQWLKYVSSRYFLHANKDVARIKMIEERLK